MTSSSEFPDRPHPNPVPGETAPGNFRSIRGIDRPGTPEGEGLEKRVTLAAVAGAHGLAGEVRLKLFTEDAEGLRRYKSFDSDGRALTLKSVRPVSGGAIARFAEVPDRSAAEALRGKALTVPRDALPPLDDGEYYHADLIGLPVVAPDGQAVGIVTSVEDFGAGDVIDIARPDGKSFMAPMHAVTVEAERLIIDPVFIT